MEQHVTVSISGQVQGVNFRSMIKVRALSLGLTGTVQNQPDGTVRLEIEGQKGTLEEFMRWINSRPAGIRIDGVDDFWSPSRRQFTSFTILG